MEEKVEIETPSGKVEVMLSGPLSFKQRKTINSILGGGRTFPLDKEGNPQVQVKLEETYDFQMKLVEFTIKSPDSMKPVGVLENLPEQEFSKLFSAASRVTSQTQAKADATEKKSESPSSAG